MAASSVRVRSWGRVNPLLSALWGHQPLQTHRPVSPVSPEAGIHECCCCCLGPGLAPSQTVSVRSTTAFPPLFLFLTTHGSIKGLAGPQQHCPPLLPCTAALSLSQSVSPLIPVTVLALSHRLPLKAARDRPEELSHLLVAGSWNAGLAPWHPAEVRGGCSSPAQHRGLWAGHAALPCFSQPGLSLARDPLPGGEGLKIPWMRRQEFWPAQRDAAGI